MEQMVTSSPIATDSEILHAASYVNSASEVLLDILGRQAPIRRAGVLLAIATTPGITRAEVGNHVMGSASAIHQDLLALGETDRNGRPGKKLIEHYQEAPFGLQHLYRLTAAGERAMERLVEATDEVDIM